MNRPGPAEAPQARRLAGSTAPEVAGEPRPIGFSPIPPASPGARRPSRGSTLPGSTTPPLLDTSREGGRSLRGLRVSTRHHTQHRSRTRGRRTNSVRLGPARAVGAAPLANAPKPRREAPHRATRMQPNCDDGSTRANREHQERRLKRVLDLVPISEHSATDPQHHQAVSSQECSEGEFGGLILLAPAGGEPAHRAPRRSTRPVSRCATVPKGISVCRGKIR